MLGMATQLVQEIPEFLFGEGSPESSGGASLDGVAVSPQAVMEDTCPLRDLLHCLPDTPMGLLGLATTPSGSSSSSTPRAGGPGSPLPIMKTEAASGDCPLQGLLNCLKEIPEARDRHPSPSGGSDPRLREDPGAWKRNSGGLRPLQTPPPGPGPGAGSMLSAVKVEDSWPQGSPEPTSCQLSKRPHGPSAASSPRNVRDTAPAQVRVPSWGPAAQEVVMGPLPALGLQGCTRDSPALPLGSQGTPSSFSSSSSSDGDLDFQSPECSQGHRPGKGPATKPSPLHCLENSLKGILPEGPLRFGCLASLGPSPRSSSSSSISSSEGEDLRPEPELWQPLLQERDHPPSGKGLGTLSPQRGGPRAGCSPGEGLRRLEPGHRCDFSAEASEFGKYGLCFPTHGAKSCALRKGSNGPSWSRGGLIQLLQGAGPCSLKCLPELRQTRVPERLPDPTVMGPQTTAFTELWKAQKTVLETLIRDD
ncbi:hypothetical protein MJG53_006731 [Ovis ammon polii x Ovis aries]|uniref:Uncharacterized protein n=1 Tax=Ovis ammon polii x Ovis aries TaxID=2918886 RepID=A0ACB9V5M4_9CETA|nr:hypothetical protein MJG53_006731 [Ovis ammon polii x Ovis aries]